MGFMFSKLVRWAVFLYILYSGAQYFLRWKSYTFSPKEFRSLASKAHGSSGTNGASATSQLAHELIRTYGVSIVPDPKWTPLVASGLNLKIQLLHSSLTEYIAMFNAPFASSGRSGFHWTNSTCTVLAGQVMRTEDHPKNVANNKETFKAGGNFRHGQFASYVYSFADDTYIACYGRGVVPVSILWPFAGSLSAGDPGLLFTQVYHFGEATFVNAIAGLQKTFDYYKQKALKTEL